METTSKSSFNPLINLRLNKPFVVYLIFHASQLGNMHFKVKVICEYLRPHQLCLIDQILATHGYMTESHPSRMYQFRQPAVVVIIFFVFS